MKFIYTFLLYNFLFAVTPCLAQVNNAMTVMDDCDKVQSLMTILEEFQGSLINDNAYECESAYILEGFKEARVIVPGKEAKYWTVNMNSEELQQIEAETKYMELVQKLMRCTYLNSWTGAESILEDAIYHYNFKQTISNTDHYKSILASLYKLKNTELYKVEITLIN